MTNEEPKTKAVFWSCPDRPPGIGVDGEHLISWVDGVARCRCGNAGPPAFFPLAPDESMTREDIRLTFGV